MIALSSLAPNPLYKVNLEPVILAAVSKSNIPKICSYIPVCFWVQNQTL